MIFGLVGSSVELAQEQGKPFAFVLTQAKPKLVVTSHEASQRPNLKLGLLCKLLKGLVGLPGFEPGTSCTPSKNRTPLLLKLKDLAFLKPRQSAGNLRD